jgi:MipA family protein
MPVYFLVLAFLIDKVIRNHIRFRRIYNGRTKYSMKQFLIILIFFFISPGTLLALDISSSLGGIGLIRPVYEGSKEYKVDPLPMLDITIGKYGFLDSDRGLGGYLLKHRMLEFGGSLGYYESREEGDSDKLKGFGDIDDGTDGRMFANLILGSYSLSFQIRHDLSNNHEGTLFDIGAGYSFKPLPFADWKLKMGMTYADENYMQTYFGVTQDQVNESGLISAGVPFVAKAGWKDISLNSKLSVELGRHWQSKLLFGYKRLIKDAAFSPLVKELGSSDQYHFGIGLAYKFSGRSFRLLR